MPESQPADPLDRAVDAVVVDNLGDPLLTPDETLLRGEMSTVVAAVRAVRAGDEPGRWAEPRLDRVRLLDACRRAIVRDWSGEERFMRETLQAMEEVREAWIVESGGSTTPGQTLDPFSRRLLREVAHMMRSPLGSLVMMADTMRDSADGARDERQERMLAIIHRAAVGIATTAGDLLVLVSEEERVGTRSTFSLVEMVDAVMDVARPVAEARGGSLLVEASNVTAEREGPAIGLAQALLSVTLATARTVRGGEVRVRVVDDGEGRDSVTFHVAASEGEESIDGRADLLYRLFRIDPESGSYTISQEGLGFSSARALLEAMGSHLTIEVQNGTPLASFTIALPRVG